MRIRWFSVSARLALLLVFGTGSLASVQAQELTDPLIQIGSPGTLYSEILGEEREYWVHLPETYSPSSDVAYPVMYLLDGGQLLGGLAAIQQFYGFFRLPEMIVIAISNADNRTRDLTPTVVESRRGAAVEESGGADAFRDFLADELIPHVDASFATTPHRVLVGHSYGGLFVIDTLTERDDLFTNYVALDPSLDWEEGGWLEQSLETLSSKQLDGHSLYVAIANEIIRFSDTLTFDTVSLDSSPFSIGIRSKIKFVEAQEVASNGLSFSWKFYEKDIHGSIPLVGMRDALVEIYDFWEMKRPSLYNDPDTPTETILSMIRDQSQAREEGMGYPIPMELDLLEMLGNFYADIGLTSKAKGVLSLAAEYYPETLSLHESLVGVCLELQEEACAREHAAKADELSGTAVQQDKVSSAFGDSD